MSKKKETTRRAIKRILRENMWFGRDDKMHGIAVTADLIEREVAELSYQEGWKNAMDPGEGFTMAKITTRHPENYLLINIEDGTCWSLQGGRWKKAKKLVATAPDGTVTEVFDLETFRIIDKKEGE